MNPTAEDILNMDLIWVATRKVISAIKNNNPGPFSEEQWSELEDEWFDYLKETMEEYSLLKSKEAASDGFDAGCKHGFDPEQFHSTADAKETYMKKYDTTGS